MLSSTRSANASQWCPPAKFTLLLESKHGSAQLDASRLWRHHYEGRVLSIWSAGPYKMWQERVVVVFFFCQFEHKCTSDWTMWQLFVHLLCVFNGSMFPQQSCLICIICIPEFHCCVYRGTGGRQ